MTGIRKWMRLEQSVFDSMKITHSARVAAEYQRISQKAMEALRIEDEKWTREGYFGPVEAHSVRGTKYMRDLHVADHVNAVLVGLRRLDEKLEFDQWVRNEGSVAVFCHDWGKVNKIKCREDRKFRKGESYIYSREHSEESCRLFDRDCPEWLQQRVSYDRIWEMIFYHHRPWNANRFLRRYLLGLHMVDWAVSQVFERRIHTHVKPIGHIAVALIKRFIENAVTDRDGNLEKGNYDRFNLDFRKRMVTALIEVLNEMADDAERGSGTPLGLEALPRPLMAMAAHAS